MKTLLIFIFLVLIQTCLHSQTRGSTTSDELNNYMKLNNREVRLMEFKDNDEMLRIKLKQLEIINKSRKKYRVSPVKLDILASRVANRACKEAAENSYVSHWNLAGEKPYMRYAFAGGYDHVSENVFGEWTTGTYETSDSWIAKKMESGHATFMAERAPNDGHKTTIIDKKHNYVGIGVFASEKQFRYYEEFIDRYFEYEDIPAVLKINESGSITVKTDGLSFLYYLIAYREKYPVPMKTAQLNKTGSYQDFSTEEYMRLTAWELSKHRDGNTYKIPLKFSKEGLYYIHIFLDKKEIKNPSALDTKGKAEGCGIIIKVIK
jgi:hypothetical protein